MITLTKRKKKQTHTHIIFKCVAPTLAKLTTKPHNTYIYTHKQLIIIFLFVFACHIQNKRSHVQSSLKLISSFNPKSNCFSFLFKHFIFFSLSLSRVWAIYRSSHNSLSKCRCVFQFNITKEFKWNKKIKAKQKKNTKKKIN